MNEVIKYRVGIERLDHDGLPLEHIDYWDEEVYRQDTTTALEIALFRYKSLEIQKDYSAKYLMAFYENEDGDEVEVLMNSEGYKYGK